MSGERYDDLGSVVDPSGSQAQHPDPAIPTALIRATRAAYYGSTPTWPATMIEPRDSELARWSELWAHPQAAVWFQTEQEHAVATLVRLEQRCGRRRSSAPAQAELQRCHRELGVETGSS
jgi:hypothetical protein